MSIKIKLHFWPNKNCGFGHVSLTLTDESSYTKQIYISYAMGDNLLEDQHKHGVPSIDIILPSINDVTYDQIISKYNQSAYSPTQNHIKNPNYKKNYNLITNNCAHCVEYILFEAGYLKDKSDHKFALTPYEITKQAVAIQRQTILDTKHANTDEEKFKKANKLIENTLLRLKIKNKSKNIPSMKIKNKIQLLKKIACHGSQHSSNDFINKLIDVRKHIHGKTALELDQTLDCLGAHYNKTDETKKIEAKKPSNDANAFFQSPELNNELCQEIDGLDKNHSFN